MNDQTQILKEIEKILVEQSFGGYPMSPASAMNWEAGQYKKAHQPAIDVVEPIVKRTIDVVYENRHRLLDMLEFGTLFIPLAGPYISAGIGLYHAKLYYDEGNKKMAGMYLIFAALPMGGPIAKGVMNGNKYIKSLFTTGGKESINKVAKAIETGKVSGLTKTEVGAVEEIIQLSEKPNVVLNLQKEAIEQTIGKETIEQIGKKSPRVKHFFDKTGEYIWKGGDWVIKNVGPAVVAWQAYDDVSDIVLGPKDIVVADEEYVSQFGDPHSKEAKEKAWAYAKEQFMSDGEGPDNTKLKNAWLDPKPYGDTDVAFFMATDRYDKTDAEQQIDKLNEPYTFFGGWRPNYEYKNAPVIVPPKYQTKDYKEASKVSNNARNFYKEFNDKIPEGQFIKSSDVQGLDILNKHK